MTEALVDVHNCDVSNQVRWVWGLGEFMPEP
jgi:hypothetical protein